jgi:hypothetical protein
MDAQLDPDGCMRILAVLKRIHEQLRDGILNLKVVPRMEGRRVMLDGAGPSPERFEGKRVAAIDSVNVIAIQKVRFSASGAQR